MWFFSLWWRNWLTFVLYSLSLILAISNLCLTITLTLTPNLILTLILTLTLTSKPKWPSKWLHHHWKNELPPLCYGQLHVWASKWIHIVFLNHPPAPTYYKKQLHNPTSSNPNLLWSPKSIYCRSAGAEEYNIKQEQSGCWSRHRLKGAIYL